MVYRVAAGLFFLFVGLQDLGVVSIGNPILGVIALIAGIALLAGF